MISKNQIKIITALHNKKNRIQEKLFFAEGEKIVSEFLSSEFIVKKVFALRPWLIENKSLISKLGKNDIVEVSIDELNKISALKTANSVFAVFEIPNNTPIDILAIMNKLTLVLDNIQDPGNLGTIIRIADWFGIENIICSSDTVDVYNPKVVQATMGSLSRVSVNYYNLKEFLTNLKGTIPIYGAILGGENIYSSEIENKGLIIMGNESKGISDEIYQLINNKIEIPRLGKAESLNVGIATAIICAEFRRRELY